MTLQLPKSWHDVNLRQLVELDQLRTREDLDDTELMTQTLSVLSGVHIDEVEALPRNYLIGKYNKLSWLDTYPETKPKRPRYRLKGKMYRITTNPASISAGEFATLQTLASDGRIVENLHKIMACLMIEQRKNFIGWQDVRYGKVEAAEQFKIKSELVLNHMSVADCYPYALFFSTLLPELLKVSQTYLERQAKKLRRELRKEMRGGL